MAALVVQAMTKNPRDAWEGFVPDEMVPDIQIRRLGVAYAVAFVLTVVAANWTLKRFGIWHIGGWLVPSGVLWIGLAFTLRDLTQEALGRLAVIAAVLVGAVLSLLVSPTFAVASAVAFLVSELVDFAVYTPLRERHWLAAVALSGTVGLILDSMIFLRLAFGSLEFLPGQIIGKGAVLALTVALLVPWRRRREALAWDA